MGVQGRYSSISPGNRRCAEVGRTGQRRTPPVTCWLPGRRRERNRGRASTEGSPGWHQSWVLESVRFEDQVRHMLDTVSHYGDNQASLPPNSVGVLVVVV